jgi:type II secretory pathway component PulJ
MTVRPSSASARRRRQAGLGLIEVMIATGVFAMLAGFLFASLWNGQSLIARLDRQSPELEQNLAMRRSLGAWIQSASVAGISADGSEPVFVGTPDRMMFHTTIADRGGEGGLYRIEARVDVEERGGTVVSHLIVSRQRIAVVAGASGRFAGPVEASPILSRAGRLELAYAAPATADGERWLADWASPSELPARVRIADAAGPLMSAGIAMAKDPRCLLRRGVEMLAGGECTVR